MNEKRWEVKLVCENGWDTKRGQKSKWVGFEKWCVKNTEEGNKNGCVGNKNGFLKRGVMWVGNEKH